MTVDIKKELLKLESLEHVNLPKLYELLHDDKYYYVV